ncbi:MAG: hypothetical protein ACO3TI_06365 [Aquiluna sp.]
MSNSTYIVENGEKRLLLPDGSKCDVVAPLSLEEGTATRLIESQRTLLANINTNLGTLLTVAGGTIPARIDAAADLVVGYTYLDAGTIDQRIATATYTSASVNASYRDTFSYAGSSGGYYLTGTTRTIL